MLVSAIRFSGFHHQLSATASNPCQGFDAPLVPRQKNKEFRDKMYQTLKESNPKDAEDFNRKFRPGAVLE